MSADEILQLTDLSVSYFNLLMAVSGCLCGFLLDLVLFLIIANIR